MVESIVSFRLGSTTSSARIMNIREPTARRENWWRLVVDLHHLNQADKPKCPQSTLGSLIWNSCIGAFAPSSPYQIPVSRETIQRLRLAAVSNHLPRVQSLRTDDDERLSVKALTQALLHSVHEGTICRGAYPPCFATFVEHVDVRQLSPVSDKSNRDAFLISSPSSGPLAASECLSRLQ